LTRIGIVFPPLVQIRESRFHLALQNAAIELESNGRTRLVNYSNVDSDASTPSYRKLIADIEDHRLAGLVLLIDGRDARQRFQNSNLLDGRLKLVFIANDALPGTTQITMELPVEKVLRDLVTRGRRRLAVIHAAFAPSNTLSPVASQWLATAQRLGIETRPEWFFPVHPYTPQAAAPIARLLMSLPENQRPDAVVVTDDHLVEEATRGLRDSGVVAGRDVSVYALCNFPWPPPSLVEVRRYGFDARLLLRAAVDAIEQDMDGKQHPAVVTLPILFEEDVVFNRTLDPHTAL
jgi:DNA-binding LacI/PurR family transcriptional regulator